MGRKKVMTFAVERNVTPWNEAGLWIRWAVCEAKGEACLIAKLLNDHFSGNDYHVGEEVRVVDTATGLLVTKLVSGAAEKEGAR